MYVFYIIRARKRHKCRDCGLIIAAKTLYHRSAFVSDDNDFGATKNCLTCALYWAKLCDEKDRDTEFDDVYSEARFGYGNPEWESFKNVTLPELLTHSSAGVRAIGQAQLTKLKREEGRRSKC
jgi:hypothetical protein